MVSHVIKRSFSVAGSNHGKHIYKKDRQWQLVQEETCFDDHHVQKSGFGFSS
jgi:hypothetical protein